MAFLPFALGLHGDSFDGRGEHGKTSFEATPIAIGATLYSCTSFNRVITAPSTQRRAPMGTSTKPASPNVWAPMSGDALVAFALPRK